jgi:hypothetical protein
MSVGFRFFPCVFRGPPRIDNREEQGKGDTNDQPNSGSGKARAGQKRLLEINDVGATRNTSKVEAKRYAPKNPDRPGNTSRQNVILTGFDSIQELHTNLIISRVA